MIKNLYIFDKKNKQFFISGSGGEILKFIKYKTKIYSQQKLELNARSVCRRCRLFLGVSKAPKWRM